MGVTVSKGGAGVGDGLASASFNISSAISEGDRDSFITLKTRSFLASFVT